MSLTDTHRRRVLVFGANGYIGAHLVPKLLDAGLPVRAAARNLDLLQAQPWTGAERVSADALQPWTLPPVLAGIDVAYYLVHSMAAGRDFGQLDIQAAGNFADAAADAGVRRIVYLGGLIPHDARSEHLVSRRDTGARLREGPVPVTELRAGIIVGPGSAAFEVIRDLVNALPWMVTPKWVRSRSSPIALDNLLYYLLHVPEIPETEGAVLDAAGPDYLTYEEMMRVFGAVVGKRPRILPVPVLTPQFSSYWLGLVTAVPTPVARALIGGLCHDIPADDAKLRQLIPQRLLTFHESVVAALETERRIQPASRWTQGAMMYRENRQDYAFYAKRAGATGVTTASPHALWQVIAAVGGNTGYYYGGILWDLRAAMDRAVGGPGLGHGRAHPTEIRVGDQIDSWTVLALEPDRRLTLSFGMRAPGAGVLEFAIEPLANHRARLSITAYWHPHGVWGLSYWFAMMPAHVFIFRGMVAEVIRRAEVIEHQASHPTGHASALTTAAPG